MARGKDRVKRSLANELRVKESKKLDRDRNMLCERILKKSFKTKPPENSFVVLEVCCVFTENRPTNKRQNGKPGAGGR